MPGILNVSHRSRVQGQCSCMQVASRPLITVLRCEGSSQQACRLKRRSVMRTSSIQFPSGHFIAAHAFVRAWHALNAMSVSEMRNGCVPNFTTTGREASLSTVKKWIQSQLSDRINSHIEDFGRGRKWDARWQRECARAARLANTSSLPVSNIPADLRSRLAHRAAMRVLECPSGCSRITTVCLRKRCSQCGHWMTP